MKAIDTASARGLLARLRSLDWGWTAAEVPELLRRFGWVSVASAEGGAVIADARFGLTGSEVRILLDGDKVDSIVVRVTGSPEEGDDARLLAHGTFVALVRTATELFGEPTRRIQNDDPQVDWRDERTTLSVGRIAGAASVTLMTNEYRDFWDEELDDDWEA
jgi:hypothetical protein